MINIFLQVKELCEARLKKFKGHLFMRSKAGLTFVLTVNKYSFTTCPSDNNFFHENLIRKYIF